MTQVAWRDRKYSTIKELSVAVIEAYPESGLTEGYIQGALREFRKKTGDYDLDAALKARCLFYRGLPFKTLLDAVRACASRHSISPEKLDSFYAVCSQARKRDGAEGFDLDEVVAGYRPNLSDREITEQRDRGFKLCPRCNLDVPLDEFSDASHVRDGKYPYCKICAAGHSAYRAATNGDMVNGYFCLSHEGFHDDGLPDEVMVPFTRVTWNQMFAEQGGQCAVCRGRHQDAGSGTSHRPLAVDHDHTTGEVMGLLCRICNLAEGYIKSPEQVVDLIRYKARRRLTFDGWDALLKVVECNWSQD